MPGSTESIYNVLLRTARSFIQADTLDAFKSVITKSYTHAWGHNLYISTLPRISKPLNYQEFFAHLETTGLLLDSQTTEITDEVVDVVRKRVVLRVSHFLKAKGGDEVVENDLIWVFVLTDEEEGVWKIKEGIEFVDAETSARMSPFLPHLRPEGQ